MKDSLIRKEVIEGVTVVYTGNKSYVHQGYEPKFSFEGGGYEDRGYKLGEDIEMYDADGNRFYSNFDSIEKANKAIEKLAESGITAVIGPKAPWRVNGKVMPNHSENDIGVFIVSVPEKSDDFSSRKIR